MICSSVNLLLRIVRLLGGEQNPNSKSGAFQGSTSVSILRSAILKARDLSVLADLIRGIAGDANPNGSKSTKGPIFLGENTGSVALDLLTRVRELAHDGEIWAQSAPAQLLWFWWGANYEAEVKTFTTAAMEDETGLQNLLVVPISLVRSSSGDYEHVSPTWSYIVDLEALAKKANQLIKNGTTAEQQAAHRFIAALNRGADGPFRS
jgi:hypothetical protein